MTEGDIESDMCLLATCIFLDLDGDAVKERAAICQVDGGMGRDEANRCAVYLAMMERGRYSRRFCDEFFDVAGPMLGAERANGWSRRQTISAVMEKMSSGINSRMEHDGRAARRMGGGCPEPDSAAPAAGCIGDVLDAGRRPYRLPGSFGCGAVVVG